MSNGKIFTLEESVALTYDDEVIYHFPLTLREAFMLLGQIDFIGWQTRWAEHTFDQNYLDAKVASIADGLMNPMSTTIDCNDVMNCVDTSATLTQVLANNRASRNVTIVQANRYYNTAYNGTTASINTSVPALYCAVTPATVNPLCYAVRFFVEEYRLGAIDSARTRLNLTYVAIGVTALATAFGGIAGYIIGGSIIGVIASYTVPQLETFITALSSAVIDEIVCDIVKLLNGRTTTLANFQSALSGVSVTGNADVLADALVVDNSNLTGYLRFLDILGTTISTGSLLGSACACITGTTRTVPATASPHNGANILSINILNGQRLTWGYSSGTWTANNSTYTDANGTNNNATGLVVANKLGALVFRASTNTALWMLAGNSGSWLATANTELLFAMNDTGAGFSDNTNFGTLTLLTTTE